MWFKTTESWNGDYSIMTYIFKEASYEHLEAIYDLINMRINWMNEVGIKQWNVTDYWGRYPEEYYQHLIDIHELYILLEDDKLLAMAALFTSDIRWPNNDIDAFYVHHLATNPGDKGIGRVMLKEIENYAKTIKKVAIRLDCATNNPTLNTYYESQGYIYKGTCKDRLYEGNRREKLL